MRGVKTKTDDLQSERLRLLNSYYILLKFCMSYLYMFNYKLRIGDPAMFSGSKDISLRKCGETNA